MTVDFFEDRKDFLQDRKCEIRDVGHPAWAEMGGILLMLMSVVGGLVVANIFVSYAVVSAPIF